MHDNGEGSILHCKGNEAITKVVGEWIGKEDMS